METRTDRSPYGQGETHRIILEQLKPRLRRALRLAMSASRRMQEGKPIVKYVLMALDMVRLAILAYQIRNIVLYDLPEPTKENTLLANTHWLIDLRDRFFLFESNPNREKELRALWNLIIIIYDYDMYYRERFDVVLHWLVRLVMQGLWRSSDGRREPRQPWWRPDRELCPNCGQDKGSQRAFADCPVDMHS